MRMTSNIAVVIRQLEQYRNTMEDKKKRLLEELAEIGVDIANVSYETMLYDAKGGERDVMVNYDWIDGSTLVITASGKDVLFMEFGSGALFGDGHPLAEDFGYGPGTWSNNEALGGKGHWDDPNGWYYEHGKKSWGNPPHKGMYDAAQRMREAIADKAREVFGE